MPIWLHNNLIQFSIDMILNANGPLTDLLANIKMN